MRHILSILMENESGAMRRVVGLFSARDTTSTPWLLRQPKTKPCLA